MFLIDRITNQRFLVDSGSDVSILASDGINLIEDRNSNFFAANGQSVKTYGHKYLTTDFGLSRLFHFKFILAKTSTSIIGADFLAHFNLIVDLKNRRIIESAINFSQNMKIINSISDHQSKIENLMQMYQRTPLSKTIKTCHNIILTTSQPVYERYRQVSPEKLDVIKSYVAKMLKQKVIRPSSSPYASPLHLVKKPNGEWRPCGDFRQLNLITKPDRYPTKYISDLIDNLGGSTVFSKLDIESAFWNVDVAKEDIEKTAVTTPIGLFEFLKMPFGLRNSSATFQRVMDEILREFSFAMAYIDDIIVFSRTEQEHFKHLKCVITKLAQNKMIINFKKCEFFKQELNFLGYQIGSNGVSIPTEKLNAILKIEKPATKTALRSFIGMINFYRRCLPNIGSILAPLHEMVEDFHWNNERYTAFEQAKHKLANHVRVNFPQRNTPFVLTTDASDLASGACLEQIIDGKPIPLGFFSRKFTRSEKNLAPFDKELSAIFFALKHFAHLVDGHKLTIRTDHKPIVSAFSKVGNRSPQQARYFSFISEFTDDIVYIEGNNNQVADALSRLEVAVLDAFKNEDLIPTEEDLKELDELIANFPSYQKTMRTNRWVGIKKGEEKERIFVPSRSRIKIFELNHNLNHSSIRATRKQISKTYFWPEMRTQIATLVKRCLGCQTSKVQRYTKLQHVPIEIPKLRFEEVNIDIVGPLPVSKEGFSYLLTIVDRYSRWPEAIPMKDTSTETIAGELVRQWISRYGVPSRITTDRGPQFESSLFEQLCKILGSTRAKTFPYCPHQNGMVERFHRFLKSGLMAHKKDWMDVLPIVLLGIRTQVKEELMASPADLMFGTNLSLPGDLIADNDVPIDTNEFLAKLRIKMKVNRSGLTRPPPNIQEFIPDSLRQVKFVWLKKENRGSLVPPWHGPFKVIQLKDKSVIVQTANGPNEVSLENVKPAFVEDDSQPPRGRGRPKKVEGGV